MRFTPRDHPALVAAARHGLPSELFDDGPAVVLTNDELASVRMFCRTDRIVGLLAGAIHADEVTVAKGHLDGVLDDWRRELQACVIVEALLVRVAAELDELCVRWAVTKGSAVAHLDFPDPAMRSFADIDIVVHPGDWRVVLNGLGGQHGAGPHTRIFTERYGKGETRMIDGMEIDLHRRFAVGRFGVRCAMVDCFDVRDSFTLAGRSVPALPPEYRLLHACFHAALGDNGGLRGFRDVAQLIATNRPAVDAAWAIAHRWNVGAVVAHAIDQTWRHLRLAPQHEVVRRARTFEIGRGDHRVIEVFECDRPYKSQALTAVGALPWADRPRFVRDAWRMAREVRR